MLTPNQVIHVTLHQTNTAKDLPDPAEGIIENVRLIHQSVADLREGNRELERVRDQFIIHLKQCQEDYNILRQICRKLKLQLDLATQQHPVTVGITSPAIHLGSDTKPVALAARRMPTLENITPAVVIQAAEPRYENCVRLRYALNTSSLVCSVQFSPDGTRIAFADGNFVYIVASEDGEIMSTIELPVPAGIRPHTRALKWSPDGKHLALGGSTNDVLVYDADSYELVHTYHGHQNEVTAVVFNADGSWLVSAGLDGVIFVWNTSTHKQEMRLPHGQDGSDGAILAMATTPEAPFYAVGFANGAVGIYGEKFDQPMICFTAHDQRLMGIAVSPFDETIATGSEDCTVKVWVLRGVAMCKHAFHGHSDVVLTPCFAKDSDLLISGSKDQTIRLWKYKEGKPVCAISAHSNTLFEIDHHPLQRSFVSCSGDGAVCVWDYDELSE